MSPWTLVYPGLSVVFLGSALRAWGRYARSGRARWFALGVALCALGIDGLRALQGMLRFRGGGEQRLIWALVALSVVTVLVQTWRSLAPAPVAGPGDGAGADLPDGEAVA
ncbi:MAG: hypothetical protein KDD82_03440 [Planctomycetes bacterium]|nr:hypothetical protein [Planctomycetota bacterium]